MEISDDELNASWPSGIESIYCNIYIHIYRCIMHVHFLLRVYPK